MSRGKYPCPIKDCDYTSGSKQGIGCHFGKSHSEDEKEELLLDELIRLADELGRTPKVVDVQEYCRFSVKTYQDRYGSWNDALEAAGFDPNKRMGISEDMLLEEIHRLAKELGRTPLHKDLVKRGKISSKPFRDTFGTWNAALEEAGYTVTYHRGLTDEQLLDELKRMAEDLGRAPTLEEMEEEGAYGTTTYDSRFGSWTSALKEAGLDLRIQKDWARIGENHHAWNGGSVPYGPGWNEKKKELVRERDKHQCQQCGRSEEEHIRLYNTKHVVHHIQKARTFNDPEARNHPDNLVTVCKTKECHWRWEQMSPLRPQVHWSSDY